PGFAPYLNMCTTDSCDLDANRCVHVVSDPTCTPCTEANPLKCGPRCQTSCRDGRCSDMPPICADNSACTTDKCDDTLGCVHTPVNCDDNNPCTADACDAVLGCTNTATPGCMPCSVDTCNDNDLCTDDTCDGPNCVHTPKEKFDAIL